jgi:integrase
VSTKETIRPTGHTQVKGTRGNRAYYALIRDGEGRHQRKLGPAWVKDSGKRTPRGAVKWVTRDGPKPDGHLTPAEAEDMLRTMLAEAPRRRVERPKPARAMTLREACERWLRWVESDREAKHSTVGDYRNMCDRMCRDLGAQTPVATLTTKALQEWVDALPAERRLSPKEAKRRRAAGTTIKRLPDGTHVQLTPASARTKRKYVIALNGIMKRAMKLGAVTGNPIELVDRPGRVRTRKTLATSQFLRPAEVHALVKAAAKVKQQDAAIFMVSAFCGLRLGELLDLRWRAVNFDGSSLHVESSYVRNVEGTPKSGGRMVPMAPEVARTLTEHARAVPAKSEASLVFAGEQGPHVDANDLRKRYYAALERAGIRRIRIHDLRHTFGTVCAAKGIPLTTIKEWMGHAHLATTEIYTAFYPQHADAARISEAFAEQPSAPPSKPRPRSRRAAPAIPARGRGG